MGKKELILVQEHNFKDSIKKDKAMDTERRLASLESVIPCAEVDLRVVDENALIDSQTPKE